MQKLVTKQFLFFFTNFLVFKLRLVLDALLVVANISRRYCRPGCAKNEAPYIWRAIHILVFISSPNVDGFLISECPTGLTEEFSNDRTIDR